MLCIDTIVGPVLHWHPLIHVVSYVTSLVNTSVSIFGLGQRSEQQCCAYSIMTVTRKGPNTLQHNDSESPSESIGDGIIIQQRSERKKFRECDETKECEVLKLMRKSSYGKRR